MVLDEKNVMKLGLNNF